MNNLAYEVSVPWLVARKSCLTATDIKELSKPYVEWQESQLKADAGDKRCKPEGKKKAFEEKCLAIWASKEFDSVDTYQSPAMIRGHVYEPAALDELYANTLDPVWHWDNVLVVRDGIGASPDGLNVPMPDGCPVKIDWTDLGAKHAYEVKCFMGEHHMKMYDAEKPEDIDQDILYQVATQLYVFDVEDVTVVFYNPDAPKYFMNTVRVTKGDVGAIIGQVLDIYDKYNKVVEKKNEERHACNYSIHYSADEVRRIYGGIE